MGIFSLTTFNVMAEKAVKPYWQDVQVVEVNKEYPRTSFMTYNNRADALSGKFERSKYYRLLNGTWKFYFVDSYKKLPDNITDPNTNTDSWNDIQVPGNWEVQGHGIAAIRNLRLFPKRIRWEFTAGILIFRQIGTDGISTCIWQEPSPAYMYISTGKKLDIAKTPKIRQSFLLTTM